MSLKINVDVKGIDELKKQINYVNKLLQMKIDKDFQKFIQERVLETVKEVAAQRLVLSETTNYEWIEEYQNHHKIREINGGFELYNDFTLPKSMLSVSDDSFGYSDGFSIALAFEYGVGIIGQEHPKEGAWEYNINNHEHSWYFTKYGQKYKTKGYEGAEIYRFTAIEIKKRLKSWINEYFSSKKNKEE